MADQEWKYSNAAGRWAGFGPYYAMFPVSFAKKVVETMSPKGGAVIDPFCGRGTAPFVALASGRSSLGVDVNPVAWIFSQVKTSPEPNPENLLNRLDDLRTAVRSCDKKPENEFQKSAWSEDVLGFLNSARRILNWREDISDRTLMAFILVNLHGRASDGISNQMQKSRAMGPDYAIRWWKDRGMSPPDVDPYEYFCNRIGWRYRHGIVDERKEAQIILGDSAAVLKDHQEKKFDLLFTSPPYFGITDYRQDNWIRLWMLRQGDALPDWKRDKATVRKDLYPQMLENVFSEASRVLKPRGTVWIRTDARDYTRQTTLDIIRKLWPRRKLYQRYDLPRKDTQTAHFGRESSKTGEVDFVIPGRKGRKALPSSSSLWKEL